MKKQIPSLCLLYGDEPERSAHSLKQLHEFPFILHRIQRGPHCPVKSPSWASSRSYPTFLGRMWGSTDKEQNTRKQTPNHAAFCCLAVRLQSSEFQNLMCLGSLNSSLSWWPCSDHGAGAELKKLICCLLETKGSCSIRARLANSLSLFHLLANASYLISLSVNFIFHYTKWNHGCDSRNKKLRTSLPIVCFQSRLEKRNHCDSWRQEISAHSTAFIILSLSELILIFFSYFVMNKGYKLSIICTTFDFETVSFS